MTGKKGKTPRSGGGLEAIETASRDEITALQLERLKWSVAHAYRNVEHYRKVFDQAGAHPDDIRGLADLARFPFLNKSDLRDHYPFGMFAVPRERLARIHASSGTTGKPTVVGYTKRDVETWASLVARSIYAGGDYVGWAAGVSEVLRPGGWNRLCIIARGSRFRVELNDREVLDYVSSEFPGRGPLELQIHPGVAMKVEFRDLRVADLESP